MRVIDSAIDHCLLIQANGVLLKCAINVWHALLDEKHRFDFFLNGNCLIIFDFLAWFSDDDSVLGNNGFQSWLWGVDRFFHACRKLVFNCEFRMLRSKVHHRGGHLSWDRESEGKWILSRQSFSMGKGLNNWPWDKDIVWSRVRTFVPFWALTFLRFPLGLLFAPDLEADSPCWILFVNLEMNDSGDDIARCEFLLRQLQVHVCVLLLVTRILASHFYY